VKLFAMLFTRDTTLTRMMAPHTQSTAAYNVKLRRRATSALCLIDSVPWRR